MMTTRSLAVRRARRRRHEAGAAMFIVAITLGLLAAMGVYGLASTAYDVRAAGAGRAAAQGQHAAELAVVMTSQVLRPGNAQAIINRMQQSKSGTPTATEVCKSAKMIVSGDSDQNRSAVACTVLTPDTVAPLALSPSTWPASSGTVSSPFSDKSFGDVPDAPKIRIELTNPVDYPAGAGYPQNFLFTSVRTTIYVEMRPTSSSLPADFVSQGRGRIIVGPYSP